jgi:uncharacterized phiE125 gp8 family phage protein
MNDYNLALVLGPTLDPVTLAEAKAHLRVEIADDDALISGYISAARETCETETRRAFLTQTWDAKFHRAWPVYFDRASLLWRPGIRLPRPPLQSVTSINYVDSAGASQLLASSQYQVTSLHGDSKEGLVVPAYGVTWPTVRDVPEAVTVRFVSGYGGLELVPNRIRQAMLLLIGHWYENREDVVIGTIATQVPMSVQSLLFPLRVWG